jgi:hypothetical protein
LRFTVHRPPCGEVSLCCYRPSGGDVAGSVHVGVARPGFAGDAREDRLALAAFGCDVPTNGASLRRVRGRDPFEAARSLMVKPGYQLAPALTTDCSVEPSLLCDPNAGLAKRGPRRAGHRPNVEPFHSNHVESARQIGCGLLHPVTSPVGFARFDSGDRHLSALAPVGASLGPHEALLQPAQPIPLTRFKAWGVEQFSGGQCRRDRDTPIDTDHAAVARARDRVGDARESDMPAPGPITGYPIGLDVVWYGACPTEADPTDFGHPHPSVTFIKFSDVTRFHPNLPEAFIYTGLAPRWTAMSAGEEVLHGLSEVAQRLLLHRLRPGRQPVVVGAGLGQLRGLLVVTRCAASGLPKLLLLHGQIPHKSRMPAMLQQPRPLSGCWQQTKPRHTRNVAANTDTFSLDGSAGISRQWSADD